jgi:hypothetical protein
LGSEIVVAAGREFFSTSIDDIRERCLGRKAAEGNRGRPAIDSVVLRELLGVSDPASPEDPLRLEEDKGAALSIKWRIRSKPTR